MATDKYQYIVERAKNFIFETNQEKNKHCSVTFNSKFKIINISNNYRNTHAETNVIKNKNQNIKNILIIRIDKIGNLLYSKPCFHCVTELKKTNIKNIIYSLDTNQLKKDKITELENSHISRSKRSLLL